MTEAMNYAVLMVFGLLLGMALHRMWLRLKGVVSLWRRRRKFSQKRWLEVQAEASNAFKEAQDRLDKAHREDPDNGKLGYWEVRGIRHNAIVLASSATGALELVQDDVQDWEMPEARFLGEQMPGKYTF